MDRDGPATIQVEDDPAQWEPTQVDDVFLPSVRVSLNWSEIEKAVERGAVVPSEAHALWASWAAPGSPLRQTVMARPMPTEFHTTIPAVSGFEKNRASPPSLALRVLGPLAGMVVGALLTWLVMAA